MVPPLKFESRQGPAIVNSCSSIFPTTYVVAKCSFGLVFGQLLISFITSLVQLSIFVVFFTSDRTLSAQTSIKYLFPLVAISGT